MPAPRTPADIDSITPCKTRSTYLAADTVQDLSPSSPVVCEFQQGLPDTPSAATASASAGASGIAPVWKQWLKNGKLIKKDNDKKDRKAIALTGIGTTGREQSSNSPQHRPTGRLQQPRSARGNSRLRPTTMYFFPPQWHLLLAQTRNNQN